MQQNIHWAYIIITSPQTNGGLGGVGLWSQEASIFREVPCSQIPNKAKIFACIYIINGRPRPRPYYIM